MQVPPYWVAQLQMEMLASGSHSIVLFSRSATKVRRQSFKHDFLFEPTLIAAAGRCCRYMVLHMSPTLCSPTFHHEAPVPCRETLELMPEASCVPPAAWLPLLGPVPY